MQSGAAVIVTKNLRDFPATALAPYRIAAQSPDQFLQALFTRNPIVVLDLLTAQGAALRRPRTLDAILDTLTQHAPTFSQLARDHAAAER